MGIVGGLDIHRQQITFDVLDTESRTAGDFGCKLARLGVNQVRTPVRAPRVNSIAERLVRTVRQECLDHVIVLSERHLRNVLSAFMSYNNDERPHRTLAMESPLPSEEQPRDGPIRCRHILGGLHHVYARAA